MVLARVGVYSYFDLPVAHGYFAAVRDRSSPVVVRIVLALHGLLCHRRHRGGASSGNALPKIADRLFPATPTALPPSAVPVAVP